MVNGEKLKGVNLKITTKPDKFDILYKYGGIFIDLGVILKEKLDLVRGVTMNESQSVISCPPNSSVNTHSVNILHRNFEFSDNIPTVYVDEYHMVGDMMGALRYVCPWDKTIYSDKFVLPVLNNTIKFSLPVEKTLPYEDTPLNLYQKEVISPVVKKLLLG